MLVQQSYSNEEEAGAKADSVAVKLELLVPEILANKSLRELIEAKIKSERESDVWDYRHRHVDDYGHAYPQYDHNEVANMLQELIDEAGHD